MERASLFSSPSVYACGEEAGSIPFSFQPPLGGRLVGSAPVAPPRHVPAGLVPAGRRIGHYPTSDPIGLPPAGLVPAEGGIARVQAGRRAAIPRSAGTSPAGAGKTPLAR